MAFFTSAIGTLQTLVVALGAGLGVWGGQLTSSKGTGTTTRKAHETRINSGFQSLTVTCMFLARYKRVECVESDESAF